MVEHGPTNFLVIECGVILFFCLNYFRRCCYCLQFENVSKSKILLSLPCVRIEVLNQTREEMSLVVGESVCQLVLEWIKRQYEGDAINMDHLTEKVGLMRRTRLININMLVLFAPFHIWV
jgi:hypothetical protein